MKTRLIQLAVLLAIAAPSALHAQVEMGEKLRVRNAEKAPWQEGLLVRRDTSSLTLNRAGMEQVYHLIEVQKVDWFKPKNIGLELVIGAVAGSAGFWLGATALCDDEKYDCMEAGTSLAIGAGLGAGLGALFYAIKPGNWKNVTKDFPPAGTAASYP